MPRHKNVDWNVGDLKNNVATWDQVNASILLDIRDELKRMNAILHCHNTLMIPHTLKRIDKRLATKMPLRGAKP